MADLYEHAAGLARPTSPAGQGKISNPHPKSAAFSTIILGKSVTCVSDAGYADSGIFCGRQGNGRGMKEMASSWLDGATMAQHRVNS
jgi:hypothetical protein